MSLDQPSISDDVKQKLVAISEKVDYPYSELEKQLLELMATNNWPDSTAIEVLKNKNEISYRWHQRGATTDFEMRILRISGPVPSMRQNQKWTRKATVVGLGRYNNKEKLVEMTAYDDNVEQFANFEIGHAFKFKAILAKDDIDPARLYFSKETKFEKIESNLPSTTSIINEIVKAGVVYRLSEAEQFIYVSEVGNFTTQYFSGILTKHVFPVGKRYIGFLLNDGSLEEPIMVFVGDILGLWAQGIPQGEQVIVHGYVTQKYNHRGQSQTRITADGLYEIPNK